MAKIRLSIKQEIEYEIDQTYVDKLNDWIHDYFDIIEVDKGIPNLTIKDVCLIAKDDYGSVPAWMKELITYDSEFNFTTTVYNEALGYIKDDLKSYANNVCFGDVNSVEIL